MNTYIFYHIYCNENTLGIIKDQLSKIIFSGLYDTVDVIYCFLTGKQDYIDICGLYIEGTGNKFRIECKGVNDTTYERFTLTKIKNYIKPGDKFLYIHSKGTSHVITGLFNQIYCWRTYMEYFLFTKHKKCLQYLDEYNVVGIMTRNEPVLHISGNFWWTTADYYLKLPETIGSEPCDPEFYICLNNPKIMCMSNTTKYNDLYYFAVVPRLYVDEEKNEYISK